jgi:hypothetical protein
VFVHWFRKRLGWSLYLVGFALLAWELYLWRLDGNFNRYPVSLMVEAIVHWLPSLLVHFPLADKEGLELWGGVAVTDLPYYFARFFHVVPISGFFLVTGYFGIRWEKYVGLK